jgi:hypothetical protein
LPLGLRNYIIAKKEAHMRYYLYTNLSIKEVLKLLEKKDPDVRVKALDLRERAERTPAKRGDSKAMKAAKRLLKDLPVKVADARYKAEELQISQRTLYRARDELGLEVRWDKRTAWWQKKDPIYEGKSAGEF